MGVNDGAALDHDGGMAEGAAIAKEQEISRFRGRKNLPCVGKDGLQVALIAAMQVPVGRIGAGVDEGNDAGGTVDTREEHGAIHAMAFDIGAVVIGGADPTLGFEHGGLSLIRGHRAMVGVGMKG